MHVQLCGDLVQLAFGCYGREEDETTAALTLVNLNLHEIRPIKEISKAAEKL